MPRYSRRVSTVRTGSPHPGRFIVHWTAPHGIHENHSPSDHSGGRDELVAVYDPD
jgi:hypothetical protein